MSAVTAPVRSPVIDRTKDDDLLFGHKLIDDRCRGFQLLDVTMTFCRIVLSSVLPG
jgi:hypothetical protein